jgi:hypothetical protein
MIGSIPRIVALLLATVDSTFAPMPKIMTIAPGQMLEGRFQQERHLVGMAAPLRSEGRFLLMPGHGLIWRGEKPFITTTVITPAGILQKVEDDEALRLPASRIPFLRHFYDMLSGALAGNWSVMERDFNAVRESDGAGWRIRLTPEHADDPIGAQIDLILLTGGTFVNAVEIHKASGDWEHLVFTDQVISSKPLSTDDAGLFESVGK